MGFDRVCARDAVLAFRKQYGMGATGAKKCKSRIKSRLMHARQRKRLARTIDEAALAEPDGGRGDKARTMARRVVTTEMIKKEADLGWDRGGGRSRVVQSYFGDALLCQTIE